MSLKLFTTACLAIGMLLFLPYATMLAHPPARTTPAPVRRSFAQRLLLINGLQVLSLVGAGVGSVLIVRRARQQYRDEAIRNMNVLLGGKDEAEGDQGIKRIRG